MGRPHRIQFPGALYHVTSRGNRKDDIYTNDRDRRLWLRLFADTCADFQWTCHAWCQMTNHFHIVIETKEPNLSKGMAWLNGNFTRIFNKTYNRVGHVFQGRFHAVLVQKQDYLLELARYVVLNPVRAGIVGNAHDWAWSSYQATLGRAAAPEWLNTEWTLKIFSNDPVRARERYEKFVAAGIHEPSIWEARSGNSLGSVDWLREVSGTVPDTLDFET